MLEGVDNAMYQLDITDFESIGEVFTKAVNERGAYDGMVYSAGVSVFSPLSQTSPKDMQQAFQTNCLGFVETVRQISIDGRFNPMMRRFRPQLEVWAKLVIVPQKPLWTAQFVQWVKSFHKKESASTQ